MRRSAFLFFKGLGLLFAILCGIGTAVLGWFDGADWMNIVTYSIAVTGLILWGWYHFSVRWINEDLKQNIFTKFPEEEKQKKEEENEENFFFKNIREHKWKTIAFLGIILIFIFVSFIADGFSISFDYFGRSSSQQNHELTQHFATKLWENGFIEEVNENQFFSKEDNRYLPDRYITGTCPSCFSRASSVCLCSRRGGLERGYRTPSSQLVPSELCQGSTLPSRVEVL